MKMKLAYILLLSVVLFSCKKDNKSTDKEENIIGKQVSATVIYTGELSLDGCGWLIRIDSIKAYSPVNLPNKYKKNNLPIIISYNLLTSRYHCGMLAGGNGITQMNITAIKNR